MREKLPDGSNALFPSLHLPLRKLQIAQPVVARHVVFAAAEVVADRAHDGLIEFGHLGDAETVGAEQAVDGVGVFAGEELAARVGPQVSPMIGFRPMSFSLGNVHLIRRALGSACTVSIHQVCP